MYTELADQAAAFLLQVDTDEAVDRVIASWLEAPAKQEPIDWERLP